MRRTDVGKQVSLDRQLASVVGVHSIARMSYSSVGTVFSDAVVDTGRAAHGCGPPDKIIVGAIETGVSNTDIAKDVGLLRMFELEAMAFIAVVGAFVGKLKSG